MLQSHLLKGRILHLLSYNSPGKDNVLSIITHSNLSALTTQNNLKYEDLASLRLRRLLEDIHYTNIHI